MEVTVMGVLPSSSDSSESSSVSFSVSARSAASYSKSVSLIGGMQTSRILLASSFILVQNALLT